MEKTQFLREKTWSLVLEILFCFNALFVLFHRGVKVRKRLGKRWQQTSEIPM